MFLAVISWGSPVLGFTHTQRERETARGRDSEGRGESGKETGQRFTGSYYRYIYFVRI
jgi:hypothetical protein